jgi:hypothetical protein
MRRAPDAVAAHCPPRRPGRQTRALLAGRCSFDFGRSGTRHLLLCGVLMRRPFTHLPGLPDVKYEFLEQGLDLEHFHERTGLA